MIKVCKIGGYILWQGQDSEGKYFFNLKYPGQFSSREESGYYNLESLFKLKGLNL